MSDQNVCCCKMICNDEQHLTEHSKICVSLHERLDLYMECLAVYTYSLNSSYLREIFFIVTNNKMIKMHSINKYHSECKVNMDRHLQTDADKEIYCVFYINDDLDCKMKRIHISKEDLDTHKSNFFVLQIIKKIYGNLDNAEKHIKSLVE